MPLLRCGLLLAVLAGPAAAQSIEIKSASVGLPFGAFVSKNYDNTPANVAKNNLWAPVYVTFEIKREIQTAAAIVIEAADSDGLPVVTAVPLQNLTADLPGTIIKPVDQRFVPYVRPVSYGDITVRVCMPDKNNTPDRWSSLSNSFQIRGVRSRETSRYIVCSLGSELGGFTLPRESAPPAAGETQSGLRNGRIESARITNVLEMPDQWFGYEAVDIAVLGTADDRFLGQLFANPDNRPRLDALLEWVRRGGRLVVCAGRNAALVSQYPVLTEILPAAFIRDNPVRQVTRLGINFGSGARQLSSASSTPFPVANVEKKTDRTVRPLIPLPNRKSEDPPVVLQTPLGLGLVTFVAFDLDRSPFADFDRRGEFWEELLRQAGAPRASTAPKNSTSSYGGDAEDGLAETLRDYVDHFEGVPVISFGWVALFILVYTLLIGPVEYYFLKKVLERLELTWITFPIIVITVSAIAYFTAYAIKGDKLKLNKIDLIDIDPASDRIYGRMWLTIFSPRVERFTIGIEPNDGWPAPVKTELSTTGSLVGWFGGTRSGRDSLFGGRTYTCKIDPPGAAVRNPFGDGLLEVPIQIWSTKSFSADWSASIDRDSLVVSNLVHPSSDPQAVTGSFTINVPLPDLRDAYIVYAGVAYKQDNPIRPGRVETIVLNDKSIAKNWLSDFAAQVVMPSNVPTNTSGRRGATFRTTTNTTSEAKPGFPGMLFHEKMLETNQSAIPQNGTLRRLDQSWRLNEANRDELIIVARIGPRSDTSETLLTEKNSISPTKLWLKSLPGSGQRPAVPGQLKQETFVRIYVPIKR